MALCVLRPSTSSRAQSGVCRRIPGPSDQTASIEFFEHLAPTADVAAARARKPTPAHILRDLLDERDLEQFAALPPVAGGVR